MVSKARGKLKVKWLGPAEIIGTTSNWIFTVRDLISGNEYEYHASRLRFYSDHSLNITEELLSHIAFNNEGHVVDQFKSIRYSQQQQRYEVLVSWRGLAEVDDSWEPAMNLLTDLPVHFKRWLRQTSISESDGLRAALGITSCDTLGSA